MKKYNWKKKLNKQKQGKTQNTIIIKVFCGCGYTDLATPFSVLLISKDSYFSNSRSLLNSIFKSWDQDKLIKYNK